MHQEWIDYQRVLALLESAVLLHKTGGECNRKIMLAPLLALRHCHRTSSRYCGLSQ